MHLEMFKLKHHTTMPSLDNKQQPGTTDILHHIILLTLVFCTKS